LKPTIQSFIYKIKTQEEKAKLTGSLAGTPSYPPAGRFTSDKQGRAYPTSVCMIAFK